MASWKAYLFNFPLKYKSKCMDLLSGIGVKNKGSGVRLPMLRSQLYY